MNSHLKTLVIWLVVIAVLVVGYQIFSNASGQSRDLGQSDFYAAVDKGDVEEVRITGDAFGYQIEGRFKPSASRTDPAGRHELA